MPSADVVSSPANPRLVPVSVAARRCSISVNTLAKWRMTGAGPKYVKMGWRVYYDPADIEAFIESSKRISTAEVA
jgi:hypothetical protein